MWAMAHIEGAADYARGHWDTLATWAAYLRTEGLDPRNQLCTDDFAGHLAHNANLSLKAVIGLACYSRLAGALGKKRICVEYGRVAQSMAARWQAMALDGGYSKLAFDRPGTWSLKYNLVWDKILSLGLFEPAIAAAEISNYKRRMKPFGVPLDNRKSYTKADWLVWCATLAESRSDFAALLLPLHKFLNGSPDRVPFSDWYDAADGTVAGFRARSVVGGVFIKMLADEGIWRKWHSAARKQDRRAMTVPGTPKRGRKPRAAVSEVVN